MNEVRRYEIMSSLGVSCRVGLNRVTLDQGTVVVLASDYDALAARLADAERGRDEAERREKQWEQDYATDLRAMRQQLSEAQATVARLEADREELRQDIRDKHFQAQEKDRVIVALHKEATEYKQQMARLREVLKQLHDDSTASDFNEHWGSYKQATDALRETGAA